MEAVKTYATVVGWVLLVLGLVGFVWTGMPGLLELTTVHSVVHVLLGAVLLWVAYSADEDTGTTVVKVLSVVYLLLGVAGFLDADAFLGGLLGAGVLNLMTSTNVVHLVLGVWGAWAAWSE